MRAMPLLSVLLVACEFDVDIQPTGTNLPTTDSSTSISTPPGQITDVFAHVPASVDLLFLIDDSGSMFDEHVRLEDDFATAISDLAGRDLDYHVGVVTTDMVDPARSGLLQPNNAGARWITNQDADPKSSFSQMLTTGSGSPLEQGLDAIDAALFTHALGANLGFRRADAQLAVAAFSDEEDYSQIAPLDLAVALEGEVSRASDLSFSSIVGTPSCNNDLGQRYRDVTAEVGGLTGEICAADFSPTMLDLTGQLWTSAPYLLSVDPDPATIQVAVDDGAGAVVLDPLDWSYDASENSVRLGSSVALLAGASVEVSYSSM